MHGFFIDARLHAKATSLSQPFAYEQWRKERVAAKLDAKTAGRIAPVTKQKVRDHLTPTLTPTPTPTLTLTLTTTPNHNPPQPYP